MSLDDKTPGGDEVPERVSRRNSYYHDKKDRVFVRPIQGHYGLNDELKRLRSLPRVRKAKDLKFIDGPQAYSPSLRRAEGRHQPALPHSSRGIRPGGTSQKHGHVNEAAFYILDGRGYEIHDGRLTLNVARDHDLGEWHEEEQPVVFVSDFHPGFSDADFEPGAAHQ